MVHIEASGMAEYPTQKVSVSDDAVIALQREANYLRRRFSVFSADLEAAARELLVLRQQLAAVRSHVTVALNADGDIRSHVEALQRDVLDAGLPGASRQVG